MVKIISTGSVRTFTCMICQESISSLGSYAKEGSDYMHLGCYSDREIDSYKRQTEEAERQAKAAAEKQRAMEAEAKRKAEADAQAERTERERLQRIADARARESLPPIPAGMVRATPQPAAPVAGGGAREAAADAAKPYNRPIELD